MRKYSLYAIVAAIFVTLSLWVFVFTYLSVRQRERDMVWDQVRDKVWLAGTVNQLLFHPQLASRVMLIPAIGRTVVEELAESRDVAFIRIVNSQGKIVESSLKEEVWKSVSLDAAVLESIRETKQLITRDETFGDEPIKSVIYPAPERDMAIWVGFSLKGIRNDVRSMFVREISLGMINLLLVILAVILMLKTIVNPVRQLAFICKKIESGEKNVSIDIAQSNTEVSALASTFSSMLNSLRDMQRKAVATERLAAIGKLASGVGHELRTPLAGISSIAYYFNKYLKTEDQRAREFSKMLLLETNRANLIVTDLLEYSQAKKLEKAPTDLHALIEDSIGAIHSDKKLDVIRQFSSEIREIDVDPNRMRQVFINLFSNAEQAMPAEGGTITITTAPAPGIAGSEKSVAISFRDTGCGMSEETMKRIYEPLFTTKPKGIGLGMAIVKDIVETHQGTITVESGPGKGTHFTVVIPV